MMTALTLAEAHANLDLLCASHGQDTLRQVLDAFGSVDKAATKAENLITRTLGVLQDHGVYATLLWLQTRSEKDRAAAATMTGSLQAILHALDPIWLPDVAQFLEEPAASPLLRDLASLLLAKRVMEQALIYARYHAKAKVGAQSA